MKLHTLTLPTGEFMLLASSVEGEGPPKELLDNLRKQTGAVSVLFTREAIETDDAVIQEDARRVEHPDVKGPYSEAAVADVPTEVELPDVEEGFDSFARTYFPRVKGPGDETFSIEFTTEGADLNLLNLIANGTEFSPAGLVHGKPGDPDFLSDPAFARGGEPGADPEPEAIVSTVVFDGAGKACPCYPHAGDDALAPLYGRCVDCPVTRRS